MRTLVLQQIFRVFVFGAVLLFMSRCSPRYYKSMVFDDLRLGKEVWVTGSISIGDAKIAGAGLKVNDSLYIVDDYGKFKIKLKNGIFNFTAISVGSKIIKTKNYSLSEGDSLVIDFDLPDDKTPLVQKNL